MSLRGIGALIVVGTCSLWGLALASAYCRQERTLDELHKVIQLMRWELCYRLTPLPDLCKETASHCSGMLSRILKDLSVQLEQNLHPDAVGCMQAVLSNYGHIPPRAKRILLRLSRILGRYDLEGQLQGLDSILQECKREYDYLEKDRNVRLRSYRTLGICAGIALAVIFI